MTAEVAFISPEVVAGPRVSANQSGRSGKAAAADRPRLLPARRQQLIAELVQQEHEVRVTELVSRFGVTPETIRRDLRLLHEQGLVVAVRGGALPPILGPRQQGPALHDELLEILSALERIRENLELLSGASVSTACLRPCAHRTSPAPPGGGG